MTIERLILYLGILFATLMLRVLWICYFRSCLPVGLSLAAFQKNFSVVFFSDYLRFRTNMEFNFFLLVFHSFIFLFFILSFILISFSWVVPFFVLYFFKNCILHWEFSRNFYHNLESAALFVKTKYLLNYSRSIHSSELIEILNRKRNKPTLRCFLFWKKAALNKLL